MDTWSMYLLIDYWISDLTDLYLPKDYYLPNNFYSYPGQIYKVYGEQDKSNENRSKCPSVSSVFPHLWYVVDIVSYHFLHVS